MSLRAAWGRLLARWGVAPEGAPRQRAPRVDRRAWERGPAEDLPHPGPIPAALLDYLHARWATRFPYVKSVSSDTPAQVLAVVCRQTGQQDVVEDLLRIYREQHP